MARSLRIQYPGAEYHVTCRGNERQDIFKDDDDRRRFLQILTQSLTIYAVKLYSYVLMSNHFHLLIETPKGNLAEFMRKFNITYTDKTGDGASSRKHQRRKRGDLRRILIDVLYRAGGLKGPEIGQIFGIDYGTVSQERKRLRDKLPKDRKLHLLMS